MKIIMNKLNFIIFLLIFSFFSYSGPWISNNSIYVTQDSCETQSIRENLIDQAKNLILFSPNFCGGVLCQSFIEKIGVRLRDEQNLVVFIIISNDFLQVENIEKLTELKRDYSNRFFYLTTKRETSFDFCHGIFTKENHAKILVVDNVAIIGGSGVTQSMCTLGTGVTYDVIKSSSSSESLTAGQYRDMDVVIEGPALRDIRIFFRKLFEKYSGGNGLNNELIEKDPQNFIDISAILPQSNITQDISVQVLDGGKFEQKTDNNEITNTIVSLINGAKQNITFAHMNFSPVDSIKQALENKIQNKDIGITLISNGLFKGMPLANRFFIHLNRANYNIINNIFEYQVKDTLYHKKVTIFDNKYIIIGSYNFTPNSEAWHDELALLIDSERVAGFFNEVFDIDKKFSRRIESQEKTQILESLENIIFNFLQEKICKIFL